MTKVKTILGRTGFDLCGEWVQKAYNRFSLVSFAGNSFVSLTDANTALLTDASKWMVIASKGAKGDIGYTTQFKIGTVSSGEQASVKFIDDGTDEVGNPIKKIDFVLEKGETGDVPIIEIGTITTGEPGSNAIIELIPNGVSDDGVQKYRLNATFPRGDRGLPGIGSGNVYATGTNLETGKKYLFVPASAGSTEGSFVEYTHPEIPEQIQPDWDATEGKGAIRNKPQLKNVATTGSYNDLSDKPTAYVHPTFSLHTSGLYKIKINDQGHVTEAATVTKDDITALGIPAQDTNTTYSPATESTNGLMSAEDKQRLGKAVVPADIVAVTSLSGMPVNKYNIKFTYSSTSALAISFASTPAEGFECIISILNSTSSSIVQPLPNAAPWQSEDTSVELPAGKVTEVSVRYVHGKYIIRV